MKAIYACKMYRSSKRKDKIRAAINNPINKELVQQLKDYLDYEVVDDTAESNKISHDSHEPSIKHENNAKSKLDDTIDSHPVTPNFNRPDDLPEGVFVDDEDNADSDNTDLEDTETSTDSTDNNEDDQDLEESTDLSGQPIQASTQIEESLFSRLDEIKGMLNSRSDTSGVNRILLKNQELWIYYNDDVNLNNLLGPVVELMNSSNYNYLEFNRLARSDNAVVFQINKSSSEMKLVDNNE